MSLPTGRPSPALPEAPDEAPNQARDEARDAAGRERPADPQAEQPTVEAHLDGLPQAESQARVASDGAASPQPEVEMPQPEREAAMDGRRNMGAVEVDSDVRQTKAPPSSAPSTGDVAVDEALQELDGLLDRPLEAQVDGYTAVHGRLQDRLADLDG